MRASNLHKLHPVLRLLNVRALDLHKPHQLLRLNPYHAYIKPAQTSPTPASESFSYKHQTYTNDNHYCVWILLKLASNLPQTSPNPASESLSCEHQTCTNLAHSCVWILLIQASNLRKSQPILRLNPSHACINLRKVHLLLRLNP